jgi:regulator of MON1-CCZ1 complex
MLYLDSLTKHGITAQHDISKMVINDLVVTKKLDTLEQLLNRSIISESKPLACFLLSKSNVDQRISQLAMDMLSRLNANEVIFQFKEGREVVTIHIFIPDYPGSDVGTRKSY